MDAIDNVHTSEVDWSVLTMDGKPGPSLKTWEGRYGLILLFNQECLTCKTRALPLLKEWTEFYPDLHTAAVHVQPGRKQIETAEIQGFIEQQSLNFPVYVDQERKSYKGLQAEGTPHWIILGPAGQIKRSIFGSRPNALQRIDYFIRELYPETL